MSDGLRGVGDTSFGSSKSGSGELYVPPYISDCSDMPDGGITATFPRPSGSCKDSGDLEAWQDWVAGRTLTATEGNMFYPHYFAEDSLTWEVIPDYSWRKYSVRIGVDCIYVYGNPRLIISARASKIYSANGYSDTECFASWGVDMALPGTAPVSVPGSGNPSVSIIWL